MRTTEDLLKYLAKELPKCLPEGVNYMVVAWSKGTYSSQVEAVSNLTNELNTERHWNMNLVQLRRQPNEPL